MPKKTLLDDVAGRVEVRRTGYASWFDKLSDDAKAECLTVREAFRRGELGLKSYAARALISAARDRGWKIASEKQVGSWLTARDD